MQNSKTILTAVVGVVVALVVVAGLRMLPEGQSRQADNALAASVAKANALYDAAEAMLDNPTVERVTAKSAKAPEAGPWLTKIADANDLAHVQNPLLWKSATDMTAKDKQDQADAWKKLLEARQTYYRMRSTPLVNAKGREKLDAAEKDLKAALATHGQQATPEAVRSCRMRLASVQMLLGRYAARQASLARLEVFRLLGEVEDRLEEMARDRQRIAFFKKALESSAAGGDQKWLDETKKRKEDAQTKLKAANAKAADLQKSMETSQNDAAALRKQAAEGRLQAENASGAEGVKIMETVIEKMQKAGEAEVAAETSERELAQTKREIAQLTVEDACADEDLGRFGRNDDGRKKYAEAAGGRIEDIEKRTRQQADEAKAMLLEVAGRINEKAYRRAGGEAAASMPASAPSEPVPGICLSEEQARTALEAALGTLNPIVQTPGAPQPEVKAAQGWAYMTRGELRLEGMLLLERLQSVLEALGQAKEIELGDARAKLEGYLSVPAVRRAPAAATQAAEPAATGSDMNELRKQAADDFREAGLRMASAETSVTDTKLRWAYSTLAALAYEKQMVLLGAMENAPPTVAAELGEARRNAEEAVKRALMNREASPYLGAAVAVKARLDAWKPAH